MAKIDGLVEGQDPATPIGEVLVNVTIPDGYELCNCGKCSCPDTCFVRSVCASCKQLPVLDKYYGSKCGCSPVLSEVDKAHLDNIEAARNAWEVSDRAVPFPDYWVGWQAATKLIDERTLHKENVALREALTTIAYGLAGNPDTYAQLVLDGVL